MKLVIIGGVAGGASAAARARRLDETAQIVMFERGDFISFANCGLPYHVGGVISRRDDLLVMTPERFRSRTNVDVRIGQEVTAIDPVARTVSVHQRHSGETYVESYDKLIIATGATPRIPDIPGIDDANVLPLCSMADMMGINERLEAGAHRAVVMGGSYIGLEAVENLRHRSVAVTLVQRSGQLMSVLDAEMARPLADSLRRHGVDIRFGQTVARITRHQAESEAARHPKPVLEVELRDGSRIETDFVVLAVGVRPNSELARQAGLALGPSGGIAVNEQLQTSHPDIYAVGDVIEILNPVLGIALNTPLAGPANRQGRLAADNVFGAGKRFRGAIGTSICKVFDLTVANAGPSEKTLRKLNMPYRKVYLNPFTHATYYPGAKQMHMKLLFSPEGKVLGAQIIGPEGVKERIDVLAAAVFAGLSVFDLEEMELAYAPPYGSAKEPANHAGFVAANILRGLSDHVYPDALPQNAFVVDVREPGELKTGMLPGAVSIPLGQVRKRLAEFPRDRPVVVCCQVGIRGYIAERILKQNGIHAANLSGGMTTWKLFQPGP